MHSQLDAQSIQVNKTKYTTENWKSNPTTSNELKSERFV
jgi:hypothetical protein